MSSAVLVVNDDGVQARGLRVMVEHLQSLPDVNAYVVAPEEQWSAKGHAITIREPLYASEVGGLGTACWRVSGSPADCVKLGLNALVPQPVDLVVAGINEGPNLATDVLYSGTVSAAIESVMAGLPAVAVSLAKTQKAEGSFSTAGRFAAALIEQLLAGSWQSLPLLNVNVPDAAFDDIEGVRITQLAGCPYDDLVRLERDEDGGIRYWLTVRPLQEAAGEGTDLLAVEEDCVSITPLDFFNITDRSSLGRIQPLAETLEQGLVTEGNSSA